MGFCWFENITNFGVTRTNTTLPCNNNGTIVNLPFNTAYTFRFYANDSVGNFGTKEITNYKLKYKISLKNQSYTTPVIEGNNEDYFANINLDSAFSINNVIFNYNGTNSTGTYTTIGNYIRLEKLNFLVPAVSSNANNTFNFWVVLNDSSVINITTQTQQVNNLLIGSCGTYTYKLFYVNLSDEKTQNAINGTIETNVLIKNKLATTTLYNWTSSINNITTSLCSSTPLTTSTEYSVYGTIKYYASNENFTAYTEYYNFLNWSLTSLTQYQNITLYDLNTTEGIEFQLTFTDSTYRKREDILIYVYREYVPEGRFKLVELPKTDSNGQTIVHLVRNDVLYNLIAVDSEGRVLGTLNNVIAFCNDYTIGDCKINFQGTTIETQLENYFESLGLSYTLSYNEATNTISFVFSSITNDLKNMRLNVITSAVVTNRTICDTSLNAVSGTLTCDVSSVVNSSSYVYVKIFLEDEEILNEGFSLDSSDWNVKGVIFFGFLFLLIIGIMFIESKEGLIISVILGLIVLVGLGVVKGKIIGFSSGILWLIIVGIILLVKLNKEKSG